LRPKKELVPKENPSFNALKEIAHLTNVIYTSHRSSAGKVSFGG
jgi:hypothetical protein